MKTVKVQPLSREAFHKFGDYANLIAPLDQCATGPKDGVIAFFRDMLPVDLQGAAPTFSTCRICPRPMIVTDAEYHDHTCEAAMPLDQDAIIWVAPAGAGKTLPVDEVEAFYVPQGTIVKLNPGVWHHALFATENRPLNAMIVLPERTYNNDCCCVAVDAEDQIEVIK